MWRKVIVAWLLGQQSLEKIQNGGRGFTLDWLECFGWRPGHSNFIGSLHFLVLLKIKLFSNAGYAAKLHKECLEILLLLYNLHILAPDHKLVFFSRATFEQLSLQKVTFDCFLSNFLKNHGELFGKSRATCGKPYTYLYGLHKGVAPGCC